MGLRLIGDAYYGVAKNIRKSALCEGYFQCPILFYSFLYFFCLIVFCHVFCMIVLASGYCAMLEQKWATIF